ncbi:MAG: Holliday junction resolvase RuvX [Ilumatobacteraceae bacterium]
MADRAGRALGVDLGSKRVGLALSDATRTIASPLEVLRRSGSEPADHAAIARIAAEHDVGVVVVGLPLTMAGTTGSAAEGVLAEVARMRDAIPLPIEVHDERLTTRTADGIMRDARMTAQARRRVVDKVAAAVMLQSWLDGAGVRG